MVRRAHQPFPVPELVEGQLWFDRLTKRNWDEAFLFQSGLLARRKRGEDGKWDIEIEGVWNVG